MGDRIGRHQPARFQIAIAFDELLTRLTRIRLRPGHTVQKAPGVVNGPLRLEVEFDRC